MFTDVGGYGIPAIPTLPNSVNSVNSVGEKIFPQNARNAQKLLAEKSLPQMSTEHTETSGREEPPTDGTDVHRLGGYGIPAIPTLPNSVDSVNSVGEQRTLSICVNPCHPWEERYSHRTHGTHRNFWQRRASHRLARMFTDVGGYGIPAIHTLTNSVNSAYSVGEYPIASGVGMARCHTLLRRNLREDISAGGSVNSAYSVGEYPIANGVGMARCHTLLRRNLWEDISAGGSVNSAYSVGEYPIAGGVGMARCHTLLRRNLREDT